MMNSTRVASARRAGTAPVNGFYAFASAWESDRSDPAPDHYPVNGFCSSSSVRGLGFHSVNEKKAHCTATIPVNWNPPLTGCRLVTACHCRSQPLAPVTESGRNGGSYE